MDTMLWNVKKEKKLRNEKIRKKRQKKKKDGVDIKPVTLQDLMTEAKILKQEIEEDNSTRIDEQNIAEIINLKEFSNPMIDPPPPLHQKKMFTIDRIS